MVNLLLLILILSFIIIMHELGHFTVAKLNKVTVLEFSVGMGPLLYSRMKNGTQYSVRAIPIGGYVKMDEDEEDEDDLPGSRDQKGTFSSKSAMARLSIMLAGVAVNFILGILLLFIYFSIIGVSSPEGLPTATIDTPIAGSPAAIAGFQRGDSILSINGETVNGWNSLPSMIDEAEDGVISAVVRRGGEDISLHCVAEFDETGRAMIGIMPLRSYKPSDTLAVSSRIFGEFFVGIFDFLGKFFEKETMTNLVGPVGLYGVVGSIRQSGLHHLILFAAYLSINIGVINLLPIPALDGGRIFLVLIELVSGRRLNRKIEGAIVGAGALMLFLLFLFIMYNDIARMVG